MAAALFSAVDLWVVLLAVVAVDALIILSWISRRAAPNATGTFFTMVSAAPLVTELVLLPIAVSIRQSNAVTLGLLTALLLSALVRSYSARPATRMSYWPAIAFVGCVAAIFRSGPYSIAGLFVLTAMILFVLSTSVPRRSAYSSLLAGLSLYLVVNIAGWVAGVRSGSSATRLGGYEASEGSIFGSRVFFPFSRAINESSYVAAAMIVAVAAMIRVRRKPKWYHWAGVAAAGVVLIAANSRTPLLLAVGLAALIIVAPRPTRSVAPYVVGAAMLLPFLLQTVQPVLRWIAEQLAASQYFSRGQDIDQIIGLGTRDIIWSASIKFWDQFVPSLTHLLIGYGYNGHATSGASAYYSRDIGGFLADRTALTMHNSFLQTLFEGGFLSAAVLLVLAVLAVVRYRRDADLLPMFAVAAMLGLSAVFEVSIAPGPSQTPSFLLLYLLVFLPPARLAGATSISAPTKNAIPSRSGGGR